MSLLESSSTDEVITAEAAAEKAKLQKHFGRADIFFFLVCTLVGVDGLGTLATEGGAGFTWLIVSVVLVRGSVRIDPVRARRGVHGRGRSVRVGSAGLRPPGRRGEQLLLLGDQPGVDGRHPGRHGYRRSDCFHE